MAVLKQSTAYTRMFLLVQSADHIAALTGATPTVTISKAGGSFGAAGGTVTEVANGWYKIVLTTTDTNTLGDLTFHVSAASGDPTDFVDQVSVAGIDVWTQVCTEPTAVVAAAPTAIAALSWILTLSRNKITQTATTQILKADDGSTTIASSTVSDDATTFTRGEFA